MSSESINPDEFNRTFRHKGLNVLCVTQMELTLELLSEILNDVVREAEGSHSCSEKQTSNELHS